MPTDQELQKAYSRLLEIHGQDLREGCVPPEAILALVEGSEGEETRLRTLDHVMACPACRQEFELLRAISVTRPQRKTLRRRAFVFTPRKLAWAASLVLMIGAGSLWLDAQRVAPEAVMRGDDQELRLVSPEPGARIQDGMTFVWRALPEGFEYTLEILDQEGDVIVAGSTRDTTFTVSGALPTAEVEGLRWWVTGRTGNGTRTSSEIRPLHPPSH